MAYDEALAERVRELLSTRDDVEEKKMFGGLCFMVGGQMALGVEKPWSRAFETWLAAAAAGAAAAYAPAWYSGNFNSGSFSDRIGGFSSSMASTIASTIPSPPPSSSSSGFSGGGSSGGGGGGGGGGGW